MKIRYLSVLAFLLILLTVADSVLAQPRRGGFGARRRGGGGERPAASERREEIKPYDEVITEEAKTDPGLFLVHRLDDKIFYEIPVSRLGTELLWVTQVAKTQAGHGYGGTGVGNRVVRWELRDKNVLLRDVKYTIRAAGGDAIRNAVKATSLEPIVHKFPVKAWGKDKAPVIEVTDFFLSDPKEFSPTRRLGASSIDKGRSFIEEVKSFPTNIETKLLATYSLRTSTEQEGQRRRRGGNTTRRDPSQSGVTVLLHHSMVQLPAEPMRPRKHDDRVGFFNVSFEDYGTEDHQVDKVRYVTRWRLEKADPGAEMSEPVKPIVFYVGRGVPDKWRKYVKEGIESWQVAFEAAGFENAILAKDAPTPREDPDWDAEDARYSTIRWLPSTIENAMGPHVHDPRTGEILEADILMYHNILKLVRDWYFVQASPMDERAQKLPMPDDLIGELLAYVVAHEVGHSLGFPHNMKASSSYTVDQLRDPDFTREHGTEASIMDYGRFNYVAQPGDGATLIPTIGPYDKFAVEWGYRQFEDARDEKRGLADLVFLQVDDPMLRFGDPNPSEDPTQQTEDLGSDPILATEMGLANIHRIAGYLVEATCDEEENYDELRNMYDRLLGQRNRELGHVANLVGGVERKNLYSGDADRVYFPVEASRQRAAVAFLAEFSFKTPTALLQPEILYRLEANGAAARILSGQRSILRQLLSETRVKRMSEVMAQSDTPSYRPAELLDDLTNAIFSEMSGDSFSVDLYRRNLQRAYVEMLGERLDSTDVASDLPGLARNNLETIKNRVNKPYDAAADEETRIHLYDLLRRVARALDPSLRPRESAGTGTGQPRRLPFPGEVRGCFEE